MNYQEQYFEISTQIRQDILSLVDRIHSEKKLDKSEVFDILGSITSFNYNHPILLEYRTEIDKLLKLTHLQVKAENLAILEQLSGRR